MTKPQTFAEITADQINDWKQRYGKIYLLATPIDEDEPEGEVARFYAKKPSVSQMRAISEKSSQKRPGAEVEASDLLRNTVILGGDMKYLSEDNADASVYMAVMQKIAEMITEKKITLTKV